MEQQQPLQRMALTAEEAAEVLHVTRRTIRAWIAAGKLPAVMIGKRYMIRVEDVDKLLQTGTGPIPRPAARGPRRKPEPEYSEAADKFLESIFKKELEDPTE